MTTLTSDSNLHFLALPHIPVDRISGFLETLVDEGGQESLADFANLLQLSADHFLPILEGVELLGFAHVNEAEVAITDIGRVFADATIFRRKLLFREQVLQNVPQIAFITTTLRESRGCEVAADVFQAKLKARFPEDEAEQQFAIALDWGRYAELFEYNITTRRLRLLPVKA